MDLIGGPQGSGKSTFFPVAGRGFHGFNIDDHRRALNNGSPRDVSDSIGRQATRDYEDFIRRHIRDRSSFSIEVTLAKEVTFKQAQRARKAGFRIQLTYIAAGLEDCILRVANRVDGGGHGVAAEVIRDTYSNSLKNLLRAILEFDVVQVYDNSIRVGPEDILTSPSLALEAQCGTLVFAAPQLPEWLKTALSASSFGSSMP